MKARYFSGATLIELIIAMAIFVAIITITIPLTTRDILRTQSLSDHFAAISLLRSARDQAMANMYGQNTGFYSETGEYMLFYGDSYTSRDTSKDVRYSRTQSLLPTGVEVRFQAPSGIPTIIVNGQSQSYYTYAAIDPTRNRTIEISINEEGLIDWRQ